uniref:Uncharacterized protein n=1 Tax=Arion vulgaris TaxID=1028688 RepID=A0A0B7BQZ5_9EUPU
MSKENMKKGEKKVDILWPDTETTECGRTTSMKIFCGSLMCQRGHKRGYR